MLEIRAARHEEMARFAHVVNAALVQDSDAVSGIQPGWTTCAFDDGLLVTTYAEWPFTMRMTYACLMLPKSTDFDDAARVGMSLLITNG